MELEHNAVKLQENSKWNNTKIMSIITSALMAITLENSSYT